MKDKYIDICWKIIHTSKTNSHMYMYAHVAVCEVCDVFINIGILLHDLELSTLQCVIWFI